MQGVPNGQSKKWTDETIEAELRRVTGALGSYPSAAELRSVGLNSLVCAVTKAGGLIAWAERLGFSRKDSDSDFGWRGEEMFCEMCRSQSIPAERTGRVKSAFDITLDRSLRVDVKTANVANYDGHDTWYYRVGKDPQADVVVFLQFDTGEFYAVPWWDCPTSNVSICRSGGKYAGYRNNWTLLRQMVSLRKFERAMSGPVPEVA